MTAQADISASGAGSPVFEPALDIRDTQWGFVVTELPGEMSAEFLAEAGLKFVAAAVAVGAVAQWLLPGSLFSGDVLVMKLVLTAAMAVLAAGLFHVANRGFRAELQVDAALREIRIGTRNVHGATRVRNRIAMRDIEECFVRPSSARPGLTEICFRVAGHADPVEIAAGSVGEIGPVLERLTRDLRTPRERVVLRLAG